jgi:hypothetical protein
MQTRMNNRTQVLALSLAAMAALAVASTATAVDLSKLPPASTKQDVTFDKDIKPILETSGCVKCHGADRPKGGLRLTSLENILKGGKDGKVVAPGKSEKSDLVIAVAQLDPETAMPPKPKPGRRSPGMGGPGMGGPGPMHGTNGPAGGPPRNFGPPAKPLTAEQVGLVRAWIDQGAK